MAVVFLGNFTCSVRPAGWAIAGFPLFDLLIMGYHKQALSLRKSNFSGLHPKIRRIQADRAIDGGEESAIAEPCDRTIGVVEEVAGG